MQYPVVVTLSGPERTRAKAELALEKARLTIIPPKEWPVQRESYGAEHWPHLSPIKLAYNPLTDQHEVPEGVNANEEHGFLAVLAESEAAFHAAYTVVEKAKWALRVHHELPEKPKPDPVAVLFDDLMARLDQQEQRIAELTRKLGGYPSIGGAGFESGAGEFMQAGSYSAPQLRRSVFGWAARTSANTPGLISGGLYSSSDMQLSNAVSGLVVYTSTGECLIPGTEGTSQGGYHAFLSSQNSTTLATANASNPRIDLICATSADANYTIPSGGTSGYVTIQGVTGTPTSGATLSNLSGAPALPGSSLLLGYVLVPATATSLTSANILNVATTVLVAGTTAISGAVTNPTRAFATAYQPNTQRATHVSVEFALSVGSGQGSAGAYIGPTSSPSTQVTGFEMNQNSSAANYGALSFIVPAAYYYKVTNVGGLSSIYLTTETTL